MSILQHIPFLKARVRPVGDTLEIGDRRARSRRYKQIAVKATLILTAVVATMLVFPRGQKYEYTVHIDDIWRQVNLHAPFSFPIAKPAEQVEQEKLAIRRNTPPIFLRDADVENRVLDRFEEYETSMQRVLEQYGSYKINASRGRVEDAASDSIAFVAAQDSLQVRFDPEEWTQMLVSYSNSVPGLVSTSRTRFTGDRMDQDAASAALQEANNLLAVGILNTDKSEILADSVAIRNRATQRENPTLLTVVLSYTEALAEGRDSILLRWPFGAVRPEISFKIFRYLLEPNLLFDEEQTGSRWADREAQIIPTANMVSENEVIVRQGDRITEDIQRKLLSLEAELNEQAGQQIPWQTLLGHFILTATTFLVFFLFLFLLRRPIFDDNRMVFLIVLLFLCVIGLYGVALRAALLNMYIVPVAIVAILLTVIFDSRVAFFGALTMALIGSHLLNYNFTFTFATIFSSTLGIFSVRDIRNRSQILISASLVFVGYMAVLLANLLLQDIATDQFQNQTIFVAINSVLILLAYPALWLFERAFDVTTDLTLLELSDTNRPLLKELSLKAPGTFNHVLQVANLAEAAASAIGANPLLARVGALYHDIGKMVKPEYFVENQRGGVNPHDGLKPRMSALIIASHVKEGIEMAQKRRLPQEVEDFIPMHHGTTRIEYFYQRALKQQKKGDAPVQESEYRYPGPSPRSKETSILMLADGVEAASRALENPTHNRLEGLIDSIVEARRVDGQLDETDLTFSDLNKIKESLLNVMMGIYHVRVKYPGEDEDSDQASWSGDQAAHALDG